MNKFYLVTLVFALLPMIGFAQEKMTKEQKKEAQALAQKALYEKAISAMESRKFILEADQLSFQNDKTNPVSPGANFISLEGEQATIQIFPGGGFNVMRNNINIKGVASNIEMKTNKKGKVTFRMYVTGNNNTYLTVSITMDAKSNKCSAIITPNFSGDRITLYGLMYTIDKSAKPFYVD